jgi:uncharacterized protein Yka (UPF0111/DUF47 family)
MADLMRRWFLPETPDLLGMLRAQHVVTREGMDAFAAWAGGDAAQADGVREAEHRADDAKRELWRALRVAFTTPLDAEDLFSLSAGLDEILNAAKDVVREADVLPVVPDATVAEMAALLSEGLECLGEAFERLTTSDGDATTAADAAIKTQRHLERAYRRGMSELLDIEDLGAAMNRRELYRRVAAVGDQLRAVAERVWYAVVKEG